MSEEETPNVEELKAEERLKIEKVEIPVEEEGPSQEDAQAEPAEDVSEALRDLGRQFADTIRTAWNSQERREFEAEVREGVRQFADEVDKAIKETKESPAAKRVQEEADEVRTRVETGEFGRKARSGVVEGLQWLSEELGKLTQQFSPPEKAPEPAGEESDDTPAGDG